MFRTSFDNLFDNFFDIAVMDKPLLGDISTRQLPTNFMRTDIVEKDDNYELAIELPGFKKEDIQITLENNLLTIAAETANETEEKENDKYIRRERYSGKQMRRMYVPEGTKEEDIKASFENGILKVDVPKVKEAIPEKKLISIN